MVFPSKIVLILCMIMIPCRMNEYLLNVCHKKMACTLFGDQRVSAAMSQTPKVMENNATWNWIMLIARWKCVQCAYRRSFYNARLAASWMHMNPMRQRQVLVCQRRMSRAASIVCATRLACRTWTFSSCVNSSIGKVVCWVYAVVTCFGSAKKTIWYIDGRPMD